MHDDEDGDKPWLQNPFPISEPFQVEIRSRMNMLSVSPTEEVGGERRVHLLALDGAAGVAVLAVLLARRRRLTQDLLHLWW